MEWNSSESTQQAASCNGKVVSERADKGWLPEPLSSVPVQSLPYQGTSLGQVCGRYTGGGGRFRLGKLQLKDNEPISPVWIGCWLRTCIGLCILEFLVMYHHHHPPPHTQNRQKGWKSPVPFSSNTLTDGDTRPYIARWRVPTAFS